MNQLDLKGRTAVVRQRNRLSSGQRGTHEHLDAGDPADRQREQPVAGPAEAIERRPSGGDDRGMREHDVLGLTG